LGAAPAVSAAASPLPVQDPIPIGPNEYFTGLVNGAPPGQAIIKVVCPGPVYRGEYGPTLGNQPIEVEPVVAISSTADLGYTGSAGRSITAVLAPAPAISIVIGSFTSYFVKEYIPAGIKVPCSGTGTVAFSPAPGSPTARAAILSVEFVNVAV
jgi:hypothetical protein